MRGTSGPREWYCLSTKSVAKVSYRSLWYSIRGTWPVRPCSAGTYFEALEVVIVPRRGTEEVNGMVSVAGSSLFAPDGYDIAAEDAHPAVGRRLPPVEALPGDKGGRWSQLFGRNTQIRPLVMPTVLLFDPMVW